MDGFHGAAEEQGEEGVRKLMTDDIGEDRFSKEDMDGDVGQPSRKEIIGSIRTVMDREDRFRKLPGKARAEGDQRQAEQEF